MIVMTLTTIQMKDSICLNDEPYNKDEGKSKKPVTKGITIETRLERKIVLDDKDGKITISGVPSNDKNGKKLHSITIDDANDTIEVKSVKDDKGKKHSKVVLSKDNMFS